VTLLKTISIKYIWI